MHGCHECEHIKITTRKKYIIYIAKRHAYTWNFVLVHFPGSFVESSDFSSDKVNPPLFFVSLNYSQRVGHGKGLPLFLLLKRDQQNPSL